MGKGLCVMIAGIFVGAVGLEIFRRTCPRALDNLYAKVRETTSEAAEAFKVGYERVTRPEEVLEPSV